MELVTVTDGLLAKAERFSKVISKRDLHLVYEHILDDHDTLIKPLSEQYHDKEKTAKEFVFIHANGKLSEIDR